MQWRNSPTNYGLTSIALHWLVALAVFGLFGLGFWMVGLTYYSSWYRTAPDLHKSIGVMLFMVMVLRVLWRTRLCCAQAPFYRPRCDTQTHARS